MTISHAPDVDERLEEVIEDLLKPLLQQDDSDIELLGVDDGIVTVELHGRAAFGAGAAVVQEEIIRPALEKAAGRALNVRFERAFPKPSRNKEKP